MDANDVDLDLFGQPMVVRVRGRGRPAHVWSEENSNKIKLMMAIGWDTARIAGVMGVSQPTLRKHYFAELKVRALARDAMTVRRLELLMGQLEKGNTGADRAIEKLLEREDRSILADQAARRDRRDDERETKKPARLGKKDAAAAHAEMLASDSFLDPTATLPGLKH